MEVTAPNLWNGAETAEATIHREMLAGFVGIILVDTTIVMMMMVLAVRMHEDMRKVIRMRNTQLLPCRGEAVQCNKTEHHESNQSAKHTKTIARCENAVLRKPAVFQGIQGSRIVPDAQETRKAR
jgi:hypothetical protein